MASEGSISCVMPVFNGALYIGAAIDSLLRQSTPPHQIVVIDDGSTDDSVERAIAAGKGVVDVIRQANRGPLVAREAGLPIVTGDYVHFMDADDLCPAGALEAMQVALQAHIEWSAVFGRWRNFWIEELAAEQELEKTQHLRDEQISLLLNAGLYRTDWLRRTERVNSQDVWHAPILWLDAVQAAGAEFGRIDRLTLHRRIHHDNISRRKTQDDLVNLALTLHRAARDRSRPSEWRDGDESK